MKSLLGFGECMVELSAAGEDLWRQAFAGDVFNTLWYARKSLPADWDVHFHTAVGDDVLSSQLLAFIDRAGIRGDSILRCAGKSPGLYAIHLNAGERSFTYWRSASAAREMLGSQELLWGKVRSADAIFFSGISLAILPSGKVADLLRDLRANSPRGAIIVFDPNIRPALWQDLDHMRRTIEAAAAISDIVLPSFDDEARAFGDLTPLQTFQRYHSLCSSVVVVKNGSQDVLAGHTAEPIRFPVQQAAFVVDTTAAGDSFNGAFLSEWLSTFDLASSVRAGQARATQVIGAAGALVEPVV